MDSIYDSVIQIPSRIYKKDTHQNFDEICYIDIIFDSSRLGELYKKPALASQLLNRKMLRVARKIKEFERCTDENPKDRSIPNNQAGIQGRFCFCRSCLLSGLVSGNSPRCYAGYRGMG